MDKITDRLYGVGITTIPISEIKSYDYSLGMIPEKCCWIPHYSVSMTRWSTPSMTKARKLHLPAPTSKQQCKILDCRLAESRCHCLTFAAYSYQAQQHKAYSLACLEPKLLLSAQGTDNEVQNLISSLLSLESDKYPKNSWYFLCETWFTVIVSHKNDAWYVDLM